MRKIMTIAMREYRAMVATKAFLISIAIMPILMFGGMAAAYFLQKAGSSEVKKIAIYDPGNQYYAAIVEQARVLGQLVDEDGSSEKARKDDSEASKMESIGIPKNVFQFERIETDKFDDQKRFELSERIRNGEIYAFVELPTGMETLQGKVPEPRFYSQDSSISNARAWIQSVVSERVKVLRMKKLDLDAEKVRIASAPTSLAPKGLVKRSTEGGLKTEESKNVYVTLILPMAIMMLMFMVIFLSAQPMLESVLEEKSQRIAEVLLGSANPFQLMAGKLIGTVAGSLTVFAIYFLGTIVVVISRGWGEYIPFHIAPWFVVFQVLGVMFYASLFMAVGASVTQIKEAQSMLLPVWMVKMSPMFVWLFAVQEPNGKLATLFSFFPPAIPTMMMLRLSTSQTIPIWQPIVGVILLSLFTVLGVFIAARIFRIGILWQGKTPKLSEIFKWALSG